MLGKLKQIFAKATSNEEDAIGEDDFTSSANPNFITDHDKIVKLLSDLESGSPLCTIHLEGSNENFTSSILGLKIEQNSLVLDELTPKEGNAILQRGKDLKLSAFHKGIHLSFFLRGVEIGSSRGIIFYKAPFPERIFYPQRRKAPRIEISTVDIPFNGIAEKTGTSVSGYLFDISRGGIGVTLPVNRARLQRGDRIKNCQISFEDYVMDFELDVRFVKLVAAGSSRMQIGGLFDKLSSKSQTKLSYFITSLERSVIRRLKA